MRHRSRALAIAGASLVVIGGVPITIGMVRFFRHPRSVFVDSFDSQAWRSHGGYCTETRGRMVEDFVGHHLEGGLSRSEIARLLGPSDDRTQKGRSLTWSYEIGGPLVLTPGCGYLTVRFDPKSRVTGWERYADD